MFFNRGSAEPKGSTSGIQGFHGPPVLSKKIKLRPTFVASRCVLALSRSKMYLRSGQHPNPTGGAYSAPADTLASGKGAPPQNASPLLAFGLEFWPSVPRSHPPKKDMGSVSNQNCCKGFHFTKKVENTGIGHCMCSWWRVPEWLNLLDVCW